MLVTGDGDLTHTLKTTTGRSEIKFSFFLGPAEIEKSEVKKENNPTLFRAEVFFWRWPDLIEKQF